MILKNKPCGSAARHGRGFQTRPKLYTIASYVTKKFGIEYEGFLLCFCTHRNKFNCLFWSKKLRKYAIRSLIWSYDIG